MRVRWLVLVLTVVAVIVCGGVYAGARYLGSQLTPSLAIESCTVSADGVVTLEADQLANAATIAAVGIRRQLPERAVTVALATAFQESKLRNLRGGDRDSVGLFQQRPSQGWGTVEQVSDPRYASGKFYDRLVTIPGWESMRVTEAAQAVQISAYPELYEQWARHAEILTRALRGTATQAVACVLPREPGRRGAQALEALVESIRLDWGEERITALDAAALRVELQPRDEQTGWRYAHWLVAQAQEHGVRVVRWAGMEWDSQRGTWERRGDQQGHARVVAEICP